MATPKVVIVTGANRGIGRAICERILTTQPNISPVKLFATTRSGQDLGLVSSHATRSVLYPKLDITDRNSVRDFAEEVKQYGTVDVLINNAGVNLDEEYNVANVRRTMDINYKSMLNMCQTFIPSLSKHGRIVNLSSIASQLKFYSPAIQARFRDPHASEETLDELADDFVKSVEDGNEEASGFGTPKRAYSVSKALVTALTAMLARQHPGLTINCCCPGWVGTDMGRIVGSRPPKTPDHGATIPLRLAFGDVDGVTGKYWANDSVRGKGEGEVQEW